MKSITDAFPEAKTAMEKFNEDLKTGFEESLSGQGIQSGAVGRKLCDIVKDTLDNVDMPDTSREALSEAFEAGLKGIQLDMEEFSMELKNSGMETTEAFGKGINDMEALAAVSGSRDDALLYFGNLINEDAAWSALVSACDEKGGNIPEWIGQGIDRNKGVVASAARSLINTIENSLGSEINVQVSLSMANAAIAEAEGGTSKGAPKLSLPWMGTGSGSKGTVPKGSAKKSKFARNARGGIYSSPIATILAEDGDSEAVIPLNSSSRAKALWRDAGKMLGMEPVEDKTAYNSLPAKRNRQAYEEIKAFTSGNSPSPGNASTGGNVYITCSPQITIKGNADKNTVSKAFSGSYAELSKVLDRYFADKKRVSLSGKVAF